MRGRFFGTHPTGRIIAGVAFSAVLGSMAACGGSNVKMPSAGSQNADKYLFDQGTDAMTHKRWIQAREYFKRLVDTYPQSPYRQDAKLAVGDSYLNEGHSDSVVLAANEYREFLTYFPLAPRADYAQYHLALSEMKQVYGPERDQTPTKDAIRELDTFVKTYPSSTYLPQVLQSLRQMHDIQSENDYLVGLQYFHIRAYAGALSRFQAILARDPEYSHRDAVYYYLGETYYKNGRKAEALPYYDKLVQEFKVSEFLEKAKLRVTELKH
jgi:outer membrane protein assembly factor BamD